MATAVQRRVKRWRDAGGIRDTGGVSGRDRYLVMKLDAEAGALVPVEEQKEAAYQAARLSKRLP